MPVTMWPQVPSVAFQVMLLAVKAAVVRFQPDQFEWASTSMDTDVLSG